MKVILRESRICIGVYLSSHLNGLEPYILYITNEKSCFETGMVISIKAFDVILVDDILSVKHRSSLSVKKRK